MSATVAGCSIGFSDDIHRNISKACAKCKSQETKWFPWPGLWLCKPCFVRSDSRTLGELVKRLEVKNGNSN